MPEQSKFENVDLFASLEAIMKQNTGFYQSDLDIDKEIIAKAAASPNREDKTLLWFCRPSGTHCFRERDVFLKDTAPHNTWRFYMEQTSDRVLAYAIELTGKERGKIKGNLYELDYAKHYERVKEKELPADTVKLIYERGEREIPAGRFFNGNPDPQLGKFERFEALPDDPDALQSLLQEERRSREQLPPGDFKAHIIAQRRGFCYPYPRSVPFSRSGCLSACKMLSMFCLIICSLKYCCYRLFFDLICAPNNHIGAKSELLLVVL